MTDSRSDSRAPDAALRQRVLLRIAPYIDKQHNACDVADAVLAAIPEPPAPEPRRVELDHGAYAIWDGTVYLVHSVTMTERAVSAVTVAYVYVFDPEKRDAKHAELITLKAEEVKPLGWVNKYENGGATMFKTREYAKSVIGLTREPVPVYEHPPAATPSAPQSERKVERWMNRCKNGDACTFPTEDQARACGRTDSAFYSEIAVPLVRQSVTP